MPSPSCKTYSVGDVLLDKYQLLEALAEGGMGVVWRAHNRVLAMDVALKLTHPSAAAPSERETSALVRRALNEARFAAQLAHPAVCRVLDFGMTEQGDACVVVELLHGETLEDVLFDQGRLPASRAASLLLPILDGLSAVHAQGVVHRDVKPANIFLARDAQGHVQPKLLDFGIACCTHQTERKTTAGRIFGTPCYMSPEQARGSSEVDYRSDIWSICTTLYELVSGQLPFDGENYNAVLWAIQNVKPMPLDAFTDATFWQIIARGLQKTPEERWNSASELARALSRWLLEQGVELDACGYSLRARVSESAADDAKAALQPRPSPNANTQSTHSDVALSTHSDVALSTRSDVALSTRSDVALSTRADAALSTRSDAALSTPADAALSAHSDAARRVSASQAGLGAPRTLAAGCAVLLLLAGFWVATRTDARERQELNASISIRASKAAEARTATGVVTPSADPIVTLGAAPTITAPSMAPVVSSAPVVSADRAAPVVTAPSAAAAARTPANSSVLRSRRKPPSAPEAHDMGDLLPLPPLP